MNSDEFGPDRVILDAIDEVRNPFGQATAAQERLILDAAEKWATRNDSATNAHGGR